MKFEVKSASARWWKSWEQPTIAWTLAIVGLILVCWLAFLWNLGNIGLVDETEPLFAEAARQMTVTGDWITPFFNGDTRFDKPPLIYWLMAIAYSTIGTNEWAVRLPSALAAIVLTGFGFYTLRYFGFPSPAAFAAQQTEVEKNSFVQRQLWLSAVIGSVLMVLNPETIVWARTGVSDMLLSGCMGSALFAFFLGYVSEGKSEKAKGKRSFLIFTSPWYLAFYILIALAVLTKGPVGFVLPGLIIAAFVIYLGKSREVLQEMRPVWGTMLVLVIALPWYVLCTLRNGEAFIDSFFGYHNLERFTEVVNGHSAPWYFYFVVVLIGFAPWSVYLPVAITRLRFWQRDIWMRSPRSTHLGLFALFWFFGVFGFFTIAVTKLPSYVLPLMPASAILVSLLFSGSFSFAKNDEEGVGVEKLNYPADKGIFWSGLLNIGFLSVLTVAIANITKLIGYDPAVPNLQQLLQNSGLPMLGGIIWAATVVGLVVLLLRRQGRWLWSVNLVGFLAFLIFAMTPAYFLMDRTRQMPLRQLAAIATQVRQPNEELIMIGFKKPSVVFYTQKPVTYIDKTFKAREYLKAIATSNPTPPSVIILSQPQEINKTVGQPNNYQNLGSSGPYQLIRVLKQVAARNSDLHPSSKETPDE